jgi:serine phosphatase RsbU (regulator of sigma subunit)
VRPWHESLRDVLDDLENNFQKAVEIGDIEFASHAGFVCSYFSYLAGVELENLISLIGKFYEAAKKFQQHTDLNVLKLYYQIVCNLTERSPNSFELKGDHYDIDQFLPIHISANDRTALFHVYLNGLIMNYLYDRLEIAYDYALKVRSALDGGIAVIAMAVFYFYEGLVCIRLFRKSFENLKQYWKKFIYNRKKIQKLVKFAKQNFEHKFYLLDAEYWREKNHFGKAISCYEKSIKLARASNYLQEEGISNQLAADFLIANGYKDLAKLYINNSRNNFLNWGATGIARQIASNYSEYMYAKRGIQEDYTSNSLHSTNITPNLDLNTILKFSHILSREIELKSLLDKILTLSIKSAGAEKGILILETKGKLFIEAVYRGPGELDLLGSRPIEESSEIPQQIINYVSKTKENVILSNAAYSDQFSNDKYLSENNIKSVLCSPILYKGKMSGILYLENNLASSAFTEERLELLAVLSSQAAISIENARLLSNREDSARLQKEMEITSAIQRSLIPLEPVSKGYTMSGFMKPAMAVGGDYYDVINSIEKDWVVIGDVSGHGILSGLIMMMVQTSIRLIVSKEPSIKPSQLLKSIILGIDENIHKISKYQYKYMTITVLSYDSDGNFSHCGQHQDLLIYRKKTNQIEYIPTEGVWIGMANLLTDAGITLSDKQFKLFPGDLLLLFTDGITEGVNKQGEMLGTQGLANILKENADLPMGQIKDKILESIEGYSTPDDITFLCIRKD